MSESSLERCRCIRTSSSGRIHTRSSSLWIDSRIASGVSVSVGVEGNGSERWSTSALRHWRSARGNRGDVSLHGCERREAPRASPLVADRFVSEWDCSRRENCLLSWSQQSCRTTTVGRSTQQIGRSVARISSRRRCLLRGATEWSEWSTGLRRVSSRRFSSCCSATDWWEECRRRNRRESNCWSSDRDRPWSDVFLDRCGRAPGKNGNSVQSVRRDSRPVGNDQSLSRWNDQI